MVAEVLSQRALNRATLERQLLLRRSAMSAEAAVAHLVGLQAQVPLDPYLALWSRVDGFDPTTLGVAVESRALVRIVVMRGTIHLVTAADALELRPLMQPVLTAELRRHSAHGPELDGIDLAPILALGRAALAERPRSGAQLRAVMAEQVPGVDPAAAVYACRSLLPLVQARPGRSKAWFSWTASAAVCGMSKRTSWWLSTRHSRARSEPRSRRKSVAPLDFSNETVTYG